MSKRKQVKALKHWSEGRRLIRFSLLQAALPRTPAASPPRRRSGLRLVLIAPIPAQPFCLGGQRGRTKCFGQLSSASRRPFYMVTREVTPQAYICRSPVVAPGFAIGSARRQRS